MAQIASASMPSARLVRVVLDVAPGASDPTQVVPGNWTITNLASAVEVGIVDVTPDTDPPLSFDIETADHLDGENHEIACAGLVGIANSQANYVAVGDMPYVESAAFVGPSRVRLTFSEGMKLDTALTASSSYEVVERLDTTVRVGILEVIPRPNTTVPAFVDLVLAGVIPGREYLVRIPT